MILHSQNGQTIYLPHG